MNSQKILTIVALIIGVISIILLGMIISMGDTAIKDAFAGGESTGSVDPLMNVAYVVLGLAVVFTVVFTLKNIATNPAALKSTLRSVVVFGVLAAIAYVMAQGVETPMKDGEVLSASGSKLVGTGLYLFYFLAVVALGSMLLFGVKKMISK
ncbi:hypothetical protein [Winogradskyella sp. 3972H.M.0a.05]|uniref:hypothetical protein n=1 Tax=Winogradskyella sp. 3972H.M.0a.05 TaxID=2950277 RepID=UPI00339729C8